MNITRSAAANTRRSAWACLVLLVAAFLVGGCGTPTHDGPGAQGAGDGGSTSADSGGTNNAGDGGTAGDSGSTVTGDGGGTVLGDGGGTVLGDGGTWTTPGDSGIPPGSKGTASLVFDPTIPTITFAAGDISAALTSAGYTVTNVPLANLASATAPVRVIVTTADTPAAKTFLASGTAPALVPQGFALRKDPATAYTAWWAIGGDNVGAMYGGLEIAETVSIAKGVSTLAPVVEAPSIHYRGAKFNCPFDKRAFSYDDANDQSAITLKQAWDINFWHAYLDQMARLRMNQMTVWNKVPWPAMVVVPGYAGVELNDIMLEDGTIYQAPGINGGGIHSIADKIAFWKAIMQYAADRGIDFWMMMWDIYLQGQYGTFNFTPQVADANTTGYYYAGNKALVQTYPLLRGIGFAEQESGPSGTAQAYDTWLAHVYAQAIMDGLAADPNPNRAFGSVIRSDIGSPLDLACSNISGFQQRTSLSHESKYSGAFMFTTTNPGGNFTQGTATHGYWLTTRDDSYVMFRGGGDPEWMRQYIKNMGDPTKIVSINIGGNRTWGTNFASLTFQNPNELVIQQRWWTALLYSRLGYDPTVSAQRFADILSARFPEVDGPTLLNAWTLASDAAITAHDMRLAVNDFDMYFEMCLNQGGYLGIDAFLNTNTQNENEITSISNFVKNAGKAGAIPAPMAIQTILTQANQALQIMAGAPVVTNPELQETLGNITSLALLSRYYSYKLQGALASAQSNKASAITSLQAASKAWSAFATWTSLYYKPQVVERASMSALGKAINPKGLNDVKVIQLDVDNELNVMAGATAANAPTIVAIPDQSVAAGASRGSISVTVGDAKTGPGSLTVTGLSTNQVLVPDANISIGGTGANRTVTVTPSANKTGRAVITITASDGTLVQNASFVLTVK